MAQVKAENGGHITWAQVQKLLPTILAVATILISVGVTVQTINTHDARMTKIELKQEGYDETLIKMQIQLAEIQRDVAYLRNQWDKQGK